ncbi:MCE family protein [Rhodococcus opacus]|uniref:Mammalian cell entry protein n=1 Tax=Rhodococcus opacus TaxID=37919 RepID=A0A076ECD1_RHOOP|nr:MCE family protein [Rhodococcus opacus]AII03246.1 mammalian cell entry protein [Rhodococcus opacus]
MISRRSAKSHYHPPPLKTKGAALLVGLAAILFGCLLSFKGAFNSTVPLTVVSDRSGLVMDEGAKVQLNGVQIGKVREIDHVADGASLQLDIDEQWFGLLTADTVAEIKATTAFGSKYVALEVPDGASSEPLAAGQEVRSRNVTTEINTVFENLTSVTEHVDAAKLNATLGAVATGLRGRGDQLGTTFTDANTFLAAVNPTLPTLANDWRDTAITANTYAEAVPDFMALLGNASVTSDTLVAEEKPLESTLQAFRAMGDEGFGIASENEKSFLDTMRLFVPTTALLAEYSPEYACLFQQAATTAEAEQRFGAGNTGYSLELDAGIMPGDDNYTYPENLPIVQGRGGPGGAPGCYPEITKDMFPTPHLVVDGGANIANATAPRAGSPSFVEYLFGTAVGGVAPR